MSKKKWEFGLVQITLFTHFKSPDKIVPIRTWLRFTALMATFQSWNIEDIQMKRISLFIFLIVLACYSVWAQNEVLGLDGDGAYIENS